MRLKRVEHRRVVVVHVGERAPGVVADEQERLTIGLWKEAGKDGVHGERAASVHRLGHRAQSELTDRPVHRQQKVNRILHGY